VFGEKETLSGNTELAIENVETGRIVLLNENKKNSNTDITATKYQIAGELFAAAKANYDKTNKHPQTMYLVRTFGTQVFFYKATFEKDTLCSLETPQIETQIFEFPALKLEESSSQFAKKMKIETASENVRSGLNLINREDLEQFVMILEAIKSDARIRIQ
jgi:hypothetical protein